MNKKLNLHAVIMHSKPGYKAGNKHKIFDNLLNQNLILHSDQGVQFTSYEFVKFCKENKVIQSMSKAGYPYDNAPMEGFYNTFKNNFYNVISFSSEEELDELTMKYINWYNYVRPHSYNKYLTPMEARYNKSLSN